MSTIASWYRHYSELRHQSIWSWSDVVSWVKRHWQPPVKGITHENGRLRVDFDELEAALARAPFLASNRDFIDTFFPIPLS